MLSISPELFASLITKETIPAFPCDQEDWHYAEAQESCIARGIWPMPVRTWMSDLAEVLRGHSVLEVYAGGGWITKYLISRGIPAFATDNYSFYVSGVHKIAPVHQVDNMDAVSAVKAYRDICDVLLISWPPYRDDSILKVADLWKGFVIYIGEWEKGACAVDEFFQRLKVDTAWQMDNWLGQHSAIYFGRFAHA